MSELRKPTTRRQAGSSQLVMVCQDYKDLAFMPCRHCEGSPRLSVEHRAREATRAADLRRAPQHLGIVAQPLVDPGLPFVLEPPLTGPALEPDQKRAHRLVIVLVIHLELPVPRELLPE